MPENKIRATLAELHEELEQLDHLDPSLREQLREIDGDIQAVLDAEERPASLTGPLQERIDELGARFAAAHPHTERFFQELVATLGRLGI